MTAPRALVVPARNPSKHNATVIMAHGLGDSGHGWADLARNFRLRGQFDDVAFVFPHAPTIPITVNNGMKMPGWYDIRSFTDLAAAHDDQGIIFTKRSIHKLIDNQINSSVPANRIILGGFSQGGAIALLAGLSYPQKLGGIFALSSYLLMGEKFRDEIPSDNINKDTPLFMGHGEMDDLVPLQLGKMTKSKLEEWGYKPDLHTYDMGHSACPEEFTDIEKFVEKCLSSSSISSSDTE